jgi:hypothetical protein
MIQTYLTGVAAIVLVSLAWLVVQRLWQRQFPDHADVDAMAHRSGCHGCNCGEARCDRPDSNTPDREAN